MGVNRIAKAGIACIVMLAATVQAQQATTTKKTVARIQEGRWTDGELVLPLNEIVEIWGDVSKTELDKASNRMKTTTARTTGTGFFLEECRVMTLLHVLLAVKSGHYRDKLEPGERLVGSRFSYRTGLLEDGKRRDGSFVVLGHGALKGLELHSNTEDWAIGYDESCWSQQLRLGSVQILPGGSFGEMVGEEFFSAGYSKLSADTKANALLHVDSRCTVIEDTAGNQTSDDYFLTDCSVSGGGSGGPLLKISRGNGTINVSEYGRPRLLAHAIAQGTGRTLDGRASGFAPFTDSFYDRFKQYLTGDPRQFASVVPYQSNSKKPN